MLFFLHVRALSGSSQPMPKDRAAGVNNVDYQLRKECLVGSAVVLLLQQDMS